SGSRWRATHQVSSGESRLIQASSGGGVQPTMPLVHYCAKSCHWYWGLLQVLAFYLGNMYMVYDTATLHIPSPLQSC
uniref:Uncharacterized protein n=1 Tax=Aegilops tauschii subsp. strangulata TaxID=200361 RepID=A0A453EB10_AEGTS